MPQTNRIFSDTSAPRSEVAVDTGNGYGSTNTKIRRFSSTNKNVGTGITYADSASLGGSFTINETGVYAITYSDWDSSGSGTISITVNDTAPTAAGVNTYAQGGRVASRDSNIGGSVSVTWVGNLNAGDVVRAHTSATFSGTDYQTNFTVAKVSN